MGDPIDNTQTGETPEQSAPQVQGSTPKKRKSAAPLPKLSGGGTGIKQLTPEEKAAKKREEEELKKLPEEIQMMMRLFKALTELREEVQSNIGNAASGLLDTAKNKIQGLMKSSDDKSETQESKSTVDQELPDAQAKKDDKDDYSELDGVAELFKEPDDSTSSTVGKKEDDIDKANDSEIAALTAVTDKAIDDPSEGLGNLSGADKIPGLSTTSGGDVSEDEGLEGGTDDQEDKEIEALTDVTDKAIDDPSEGLADLSGADEIPGMSQMSSDSASAANDSDSDTFADFDNLASSFNGKQTGASNTKSGPESDLDQVTSMIP